MIEGVQKIRTSKHVMQGSSRVTTVDLKGFPFPWRRLPVRRPVVSNVERFPWNVAKGDSVDGLVEVVDRIKWSKFAGSDLVCGPDAHELGDVLAGYLRLFE